MKSFIGLLLLNRPRNTEVIRLTEHERCAIIANHLTEEPFDAPENLLATGFIPLPVRLFDLPEGAPAHKTVRQVVIPEVLAVILCTFALTPLRFDGFREFFLGCLNRCDLRFEIGYCLLRKG